jgi:glyoxylase-like metal-dependent hydrolase (beta-lactamase superfamily II)
MKVQYIYGIEYDSNIYVISGKNPTIIDCGTGLHNQYVTDKIKEYINPAIVNQIILTHEHYDHCGGVRMIRDLTNGNARIFAHTYASNKIEAGESDFARMLGGEMPKMPVEVKLKEGDNILIGDENFMVLNTPGHTPGCICVYSKQSKTLFSGDTVFSYGYFGRYNFPGGGAKKLKQSIERLAKLDVKNLYPGHESIIEGDGRKHILKTLENVRYLI